MKKQETAKIIFLVAGAWPTFQVQEEGDITLNAWHLGLEDLPYIETQQAIKNLIQQHPTPFPPTISEIRTEVDKIIYGEEQLAEEFFHELNHLAKTKGYNGGLDQIEQMEPNWKQEIARMYFHRICYDEVKSLGFLEKSFKSAYDDMCDKHRRETSRRKSLAASKNIKLVG